MCHAKPLKVASKFRYTKYKSIFSSKALTAFQDPKCTEILLLNILSADL